MHDIAEHYRCLEWLNARNKGTDSGKSAFHLDHTTSGVSNMIWRNMLMKQKQVSQLLRARAGSLKISDAPCGCGALESSQSWRHAVTCCPLYKDMRTARHDNVTRTLYNALRKGKLPPEVTFTVNISMTQRHSVPEDVLPAAARSSSHSLPDLIVTDRLLRCVTLGEVFITADSIKEVDGYDELIAEKFARYRPLIRDILATGYSCRFLPIAFGACGTVPRLTVDSLQLLSQAVRRPADVPRSERLSYIRVWSVADSDNNGALFCRQLPDCSTMALPLTGLAKRLYRRCGLAVVRASLQIWGSYVKKQQHE
jgi:hypothetical protein